MDPKKSLVDRWISRMKGINSPYGAHPNPDYLVEGILRSIAEIEYKVLKENGHDVSAPYETSDMLDLFEKHFPSCNSKEIKNNIRETYWSPQASLIRAYEELKNSRKQEDWATSWDHLKSFLFRTATALMIAGVVLLTGYISKIYEIPVPMLRMIP